MEISRLSLAFLAEKCLMSKSWTTLCQKPKRSTGWTVGYVDFERLYKFTLSSAFFVVRTKSNVLRQRRYSHPVDKITGLRSDQTVILTTIGSATNYPDALRRVTFLNPTTGKRQHLQVSMVGRIILQMDQTTPADQVVFWRQRKRGKAPNLDFSFCLCARGNHSESAWGRSDSLPNSTDFKHHDFRENPAFAGDSGYQLPIRFSRFGQQVDSVRLIAAP